MRKPAKGSDFLSKLALGEPVEPAPAASAPAKATAVHQVSAAQAKLAKLGRPTKREGGGRAGLKHLGGYVDDETAEQFALLKIRLKQGNDELMKTAVDALFRQESAKRKFGD